MRRIELDPTMAKIAELHHQLYLREMHRINDQMDKLVIDKRRDGAYDLGRLLDGLADHAVARVAPGEWSASQSISERVGREPHPGYAFVPVSPGALYGQRDLNVAVASAGGFLVATDNPGDLFVAALRNASVMERLGVARLPTAGDAVVPRATGSVSTQWLINELSSITESAHVFAAAAATPKSVAAYCEVSGTLLKQTTRAGQNFILGEMARAVAETYDGALINGSGASGQPTGILNTPGIGSEAGASIAWSGILNMIATVETAKGLVTPEAGGWAVNPASAKILRGRERATGSGFIMDAGEIADYRALSTGSVPAGTAIFGDWSRVFSLEWGVLEVGADPYGVNSTLFTKNLVGVRAIWSCDVLLLSPVSFSAATSIT